MKASDQVQEWSQERILAAQKKLIQVSRHAVKNGQPNLLNEHEAGDVSLLIDAYAEATLEIEEGTGLEHLPEMSDEMKEMPSTPPQELAGE